MVADGEIQRKTLAQQRAMAILVYHGGQPPTRQPLPPARWQAEAPPTAWDTAGGRFVHRATPADGPVDWLVYHHGHRRPDRPGGLSPAPVTDFCPYDQGRPRREEDVHAVAGVMLSLRVAKGSSPGCVAARASDGEKKFHVRSRSAGGTGAAGRWPAAGGGRAPSGPIKSRGCESKFPLFDQQFLLGLDGETVIAWPYPRPDRPAAPPAQPLGIGADRLAVTLEDVRVYRDVYYTEPVWARRAKGEAVVHLGPGEYYVLGDNSPISDDSRTWPPPAAVSANWLVGKPLAIIFPAGSAKWGSWHFQVPDWGRMRYIR